jgi:anti-sigma-K factor RskA
MNRDQLDELVIKDLLEESTAEEKLLLQNEISKTDTEVYAAYNETAETLALLALAVPQSEPPARLKDRIWESLFKEDAQSDEEDAPTPAARYRWLGFPLAAASVMVAVIATASVSRYVFDQRLLQTEEKVAALQTQLASAQNVFKEVSNPHRLVAHLSGGSPSSCAGHAYFDAQSQQMIFCVAGLNQLGSEQCYQLWCQSASGFVSAGFLCPDKDGQAVIRWKGGENQTPRAAVKFAVTVEPGGGSPQPTGKVLLEGKAI